MIMGPDWFANAGEVMDSAAGKRERRFIHYLQTNLISYSPAWNDVVHGMFNGSIVTSMDYPNVYRKLFRGDAEAYTKPSTPKLPQPKAHRVDIGVILVLQPARSRPSPRT